MDFCRLQRRGVRDLPGDVSVRDWLRGEHPPRTVARARAGTQDHGPRGRGRADRRSVGDRRALAGPVRAAAQRHGPAWLQADVDEARAATDRAQHVRVVCEWRAHPAVRGVAPARRHGVVHRTSRCDRGARADRARRLAHGGRRYVPHQPLRHVRATADVLRAVASRAAAASVRDAWALQDHEASNLRGLRDRILGDAGDDARPPRVRDRHDRIHSPRHPVRGARSRARVW